jgi:HSP20 family protein
MTHIVRYRPLTAVKYPFENISDLLQNFMLSPVFRRPDVELQIKIDVSEDDSAYTVKAEIPGVRKEDIRVCIDGDRVSISAEANKETAETAVQKLLHAERHHGIQSRTFMLASEIDDAKAEAKYENGLLELMLPKKSSALVTQLSIK